MKLSYKNAIEQVLGYQVKIYTDPFHLAKDANKRVDEERMASEAAYFSEKGTKKRIPKRVLMKANERLSSSGRRKLETILKEDDSLKVFYDFQKRIRGVYRSKDYQEA